MTRATVIITSEQAREKATKWVAAAPLNTRVEFKRSKRSPAQNDRMWAMLTDIAAQKDWHGKKLPADDWKLIFLDALKREVRAVPNLDNSGFVNLGQSSSDLSVQEMTDLIELMFAWGGQNGVVFHEPEQAA